LNHDGRGKRRESSSSDGDFMPAVDLGIVSPEVIVGFDRTEGIGVVSSSKNEHVASLPPGTVESSFSRERSQRVQFSDFVSRKRILEEVVSSCVLSCNEVIGLASKDKNPVLSWEVDGGRLIDWKKSGSSWSNV